MVFSLKLMLPLYSRIGLQFFQRIIHVVKLVGDMSGACKGFIL